jgi:hypothetical protein
MADKPVFDTAPKGSIDLFRKVRAARAEVKGPDGRVISPALEAITSPILRQDAEVLAAEIREGKHDAYLFELGEMEYGHGKRELVIAAVKARHPKPPTKPQA